MVDTAESSSHDSERRARLSTTPPPHSQWPPLDANIGRFQRDYSLIAQVFPLAPRVDAGTRRTVEAGTGPVIGGQALSRNSSVRVDDRHQVPHSPEFVHLRGRPQRYANMFSVVRDRRGEDEAVAGEMGDDHGGRTTVSIIAKLV